MGEDAERRPWLRHALALCEHQGLDAALLDLLPRLAPALQAELLDLLAFRQVDAGSLLERLVLADTEPVLLAAAFRAARVTKPPVLATWLRKGMEDTRPLVRDAAIETGLLRGLRAAWQSCQRLATAGAEPRLTMLALAAGGAVADVEKLVRALDRPELRAEALWALGFSGRLAAADAALTVLKEQTPEVAWLALRTFSVITGLSTEGLFMREEDEDDVTSPSGAVSSGLPPPSTVLAGSKWPRWSGGGPGFASASNRRAATGMACRGHPRPCSRPSTGADAPPSGAGLRAGRQEPGACQVDTRGWCGHQRAQLRAAGALSLERLTRGFDGWMNA
ncbi:hypothetical protein QEG98_40580 [Myxococcus sp. MxC21-1]|uniref:hypothetical protein n=1 Tax=Myxococcus sp. MxC21-1 TaxID=3041439 RepID=UPI00292D168D|nr:hypothetical protein [Myxococcus sp. MxC21-1]WNZ62052.1 hypothetical protein QEG98_40580 [Myxococcus sp. MxC21-1]